MSKRIISVLIIISIFVSAFPISFAAAEGRASNYITGYTANLSPGDNSGELDLTYRVSTVATGITRLGIVAIFVYRTDGSIAKVITGNTTNGLIKTSGSVASGTYSFTCNPGETYYCNVRFIAENASGNDTRAYTTNTAVAPN